MTPAPVSLTKLLQLQPRQPANLEDRDAPDSLNFGRRSLLPVQNIIDFAPSRAERIHWNTIFFVTSFHIVAIAALFTFSWQNLLATFVCWWIAGSWGIGIGF